MVPTDLNGRRYALVSEVKEGDYITLDQDFDCVRDGKIYRVVLHENLFAFICDRGPHYLDGQIESTIEDKMADEPYYMGVYRAGPN